MSTCTYKLEVENLPKVVARVDHYLFKSLEARNINMFQLIERKAEKDEKVRQKFYDDLLSASRRYLQEDINEIKYDLVLGDNTPEEVLSLSTMRDNLVTIDTYWDQVVANVFTYSPVFAARGSFTVDEEGLADVEREDDGEAANLELKEVEAHPLEIVDKATEYMIRSLKRKIKDEDEWIEPWTPFGHGERVEYSGFMKRLLNDLDGMMFPGQIFDHLEKLKETVPEYAELIEKIDIRDSENTSSDKIQLFVNFMQSVSRKTVPIYQTLLSPDGSTKIKESSNNKKSLYEQIFKSQFAIRGTNEKVNGKKIAFINSEGVWALDQRSIAPLKALNLTSPEAKLEFLDMIGIELSEVTKKHLIKTANQKEGLLYNDPTQPAIFRSYVETFRNYLVETLETAPVIKEKAHPDSRIKGTVLEITDIYEAIAEDRPFLRLAGSKTKYNKDVLKDPKGPYKMKIINGQRGRLNQFVELEIRMNPELSIIKSMTNAEGELESAQQMFNNFTVINSFLSDAEQYPTLNDIIDAEPSMFWLDPEKNPMIRNNMFLNSLFNLTADENGIYHRRKHKGKPARILINNYNGLSVESNSGISEKGYKTANLERIDKMLMDIKNFLRGTGVSLKETLRLGDKGTALSITMDSYFNGESWNRLPIPERKGGDIFSDKSLIHYIVNQLKDYAAMKWLNDKHGFYKNIKAGSLKENLDSYGALKDILNDRIVAQINSIVATNTSIESIDNAIDAYVDRDKSIEQVIQKYFTDYSTRIKNDIDSEFASVNSNDKQSMIPTKKDINSYVVNSWVINNEQLRLFFGDVMYFKDFLKRASKDSATGKFLFVDNVVLNALQDPNNEYGRNNNLAGRMLLDSLLERELIDQTKYAARLQKQQLSKTYQSATLADVNVISSYIKRITDNIESVKVIEEKKLSDMQLQLKLGEIDQSAYDSYKDYLKNKYNLYDTKLKKEIEAGYKKVNEADGQGLCSFDFYREMSILTGSWGREQENAYKKMVMYAHYDELLTHKNDSKYKQLRDAHILTDNEVAFFPPKKFQYSGPMYHSKTVNGREYATNPPVFDKFSLAPLIPQMIKGTANEALHKRMLYEGVGYVKFESGTKVANSSERDSMYDSTDRDYRTFEERLGAEDTKFKSDHTLYKTHLKEQVKIEEDIHENVIFGSQARKLFMMNLFNLAKAQDPVFKMLFDDYVAYIQDLVDLELNDLYREMGVRQEGKGDDIRIVIDDKRTLYDYLKNEITKKDADISLKQLLTVDEKGELQFPIDATIQAQVLENMIISAFNNRVGRYKTNGSMLTQLASTGFEKGKQFDKDASKKAAEKYGDNDLNFYEVVDGRIQPMEVKIALTGQWKSLLNLTHPDGQNIGNLDRLNDAMKDKSFVKANEKSLQMVAYRIPTQGKNFLDVMQIKEFLPESAGDVIVMPSGVVVKSGSDYDIDKMFVFYPNLYTKETGDELVDRRVGQYVSFNYKGDEIVNHKHRQQNLKENIQNKLYRTMIDTLMHPSNFLELVTPSTNYHIDPVIDEIYAKLGMTRGGFPKNSKVLDEQVTLSKFISLMKGKSDLGIAAVANTFNVLYQIVGAQSNEEWLRDNNIQTLFDIPGVKTFEIVGACGKGVGNLSYGEMFDEDGVFKSEFFSEFINAFVDVAKDDYVFMINMVTALTPIAFYMKFAGIGTRKILAFINQPIIRAYVKNLSKYNNLTIQNFMTGEEEKSSVQAINEAKKETLAELGIVIKDSLGIPKKSITVKDLRSYFEETYKVNPEEDSKLFGDDLLMKGVRSQKFRLASYHNTTHERIQLLMFIELFNLKDQSDSLTDANRFLNFDTKPYKSSFDVHSRRKAYKNALEGGNILSPKTVKEIYSKTMISPLQMGGRIAAILKTLAPMRNSEVLNEFILDKADEIRKDAMINKFNFRTVEDMERFARKFKNDLLIYTLQNYLPGTPGELLFKDLMQTEKGVNDYFEELYTTPKLSKLFLDMKRSKSYKELTRKYDIVKLVIPQRGRNNQSLINFKIATEANASIEKTVYYNQFQQIINDDKYPEAKEFFRNLAVYGLIQSGLNKSDIYFNDLVPVEFLSPILKEAYNGFVKKAGAPSNFSKALRDFYPKFLNNNTEFSPKVSDARGETTFRESVTYDVSKRGKWYLNKELVFEKRVDISPEVETKINDDGAPSIEERKQKAIAYVNDGYADEALKELGVTKEWTINRINQYTTNAEFDNLLKKVCKK